MLARRTPRTNKAHRVNSRRTSKVKTPQKHSLYNQTSQKHSSDNQTPQKHSLSNQTRHKHSLSNSDGKDDNTLRSTNPSESVNDASRDHPALTETTVAPAPPTVALPTTSDPSVTSQTSLALTATPYDDAAPKAGKARRPIKVRAVRELKQRGPTEERPVAVVVNAAVRSPSPPLVQIAQDAPASVETEELALPELPTLSDRKAPSPSCHRARSHITAPPVSPNKRSVTDNGELDILFDSHLADQRRRSLMSKMNAKAIRKKHDVCEDKLSVVRFEECDFLSKYCIFQKDSLDAYRQCFDSIDEDRRGFISNDEALLGLRVMNGNLSSQDVNYMDRILELVGYDTTRGADFKLFSVMVALSAKISALDEWMKKLVYRMDMGSLEHRVFMCKTLWECNVDRSNNRIHMEQLCLDLRAGGVSLQHEADVCKKLSPLVYLDLMDFLTYIPLFLMIHASVIVNPFDDSRDK